MPDSAPSPAQTPAEPTRPRLRGEGLPSLVGAAPSRGLPPAPSGRVPSSPPPTYEEVLAENRLVAAAQLARAASLETATSSSSSGACGGAEALEKPPPRPSTAPPPVTQGVIEIQHKSSKELYRAVAAQWGITCKMSDKCRCFDCQGRYFDCEYEHDHNEHDKGDGGLGATTPMFISEVMGGSACTLL